MSFSKRHLTGVKRGFGFFLLIPCLFYLSADIGRHDAAAAILPASGYSSLSEQDDIIFDAIFPGRIPDAQELALAPQPISQSGTMFAALEANESDSILQQPDYQAEVRAMHALFSFPEFKPEEKPETFDSFKQFSIRSKDEYDAAHYCLAQAIYFESRGEPERGQRAVAQVILNRAKSGFFPSTICGVIYQNTSRRHACQFSYACDGRPERIRDAAAWKRAKKIADDALSARIYLADVGKATHYHANWVGPGWRKGMHRLKKIGTHIFYAERAKRVAQI